MTNKERYNKVLLGNKFYIVQIIISINYTFGEYRNNGYIVIISNSGEVFDYVSVEQAFDAIDRGEWVLDKIEIRKKKLLRLLKND